ncbi:MAG: hypothetical protein H6R15_634 [Proteobacteria bacterium]|nr:hypothetical protein [Pseudomonadota bacterium]
MSFFDGSHSSESSSLWHANFLPVRTIIAYANWWYPLNSCSASIGGCSHWLDLFFCNAAKREVIGMAALPYVTAPGNIEKTLKGIKSAATPESVSQDFVKTILGIKGGSGNQITAYLKKIGFAAADGTPTDLYKKYRNNTTDGWAIAQALKTGYAPLYIRNEYMHKLSDDDLRGLVVEETGAEQDANVVAMTLACIKQLKRFAKWEAAPVEEILEQFPPESSAPPPFPQQNSQGSQSNQRLGLNLGYTINLNLPATSDPAVFNAIFRALKENLLKTSNE